MVFLCVFPTEAETAGAARVPTATAERVSTGDEGKTQWALPSGASLVPLQHPPERGGRCRHPHVVSHQLLW